jgi:hypothetical protein
MLMLTDCWEVCREVVFFVFVCDAGLAFAFEVWALPVGVFAFALASALCLRASSVAV